MNNSKIEGKNSNEWKLVDGIDLIVHIFHPEKRKFYELEKMWSELIQKEKLIILKQGSREIFPFNSCEYNKLSRDNLYDLEK